MGGGLRLGAGGELHDHQAGVAAPHEPEAFERLAHVVLPHDWLTFRLTGSLRHRSRRRLGHRVLVGGDGATASTCSPSSTPSDWSTVLVPDRARSGDVAGGVAAALSARAPATTWPGRSASGCGRRRRHLDRDVGHRVLGVRLANRRSVRHRRRLRRRHRRHLPLVCTLNATKVTDAVARLLGVDHDAFDELVLAAAPRVPAG